MWEDERTSEPATELESRDQGQRQWRRNKRRILDLSLTLGFQISIVSTFMVFSIFNFQISHFHLQLTNKSSPMASFTLPYISPNSRPKYYAPQHSEFRHCLVVQICPNPNASANSDNPDPTRFSIRTCLNVRIFNSDIKFVSILGFFRSDKFGYSGRTVFCQLYSCLC